MKSLPIDENSEEYRTLKIKLALSSIRIIPCPLCGHPKRYDFCCTNCPNDYPWVDDEIEQYEFIDVEVPEK